MNWRQVALRMVVAPTIGLVTATVVERQRQLTERADADARAITGALRARGRRGRPRTCARSTSSDGCSRSCSSRSGAAIERSDLLSRLAGQATTDELTELANRRAWDAAVTDALAGDAQPCVAVLDLDRF